MELPFTIEQFLEVFRDYNQAIWPVQVLAYVLGLVALALTAKRTYTGDRIISAILGLFWLWMGAIYHLTFFAEINRAAYLFGAAFLLQGTLFLLAGTIKEKIRFDLRTDRYGIAGGVLVLYAMVVYPLLGHALGHGYPSSPMFGVAPCPATIFTFGMLLWTKGRVPGWLLVIPGLWSLVGFTAALNLGILEDIGLLVAGLIGTALLLYRNRREESQPAPAR